MLTKSPILYVFLILPSIFFGQTENNDAKNLELIKQYKGTNNDSLLFYSTLIQSSNDLCLKYTGKIHEVLSIYNKSEYTKAEKLTKKIISELKEKDELCLIKTRIESYNRLFWIKKNQQLYNEAFSYLLKIREEIENFPKNGTYYKNTEITLKVNSALIKSLLGYHNESRKILKDYLINERKSKKNSLREYSDILNKANILNLIGESYLKSSIDSKSKDLDSASIYFQKAYEATKNFNPPHKNSETIFNIRMAEILIAKKEFRNALNLINKFSHNSDKFNTSQNISSLKVICYYNTKQTDSVFHYSYTYMKNSNSKKSNKKRLISVYDILSNQYFKNKKLDSAYKYSKLTIDEINLLNENKNEVNKAYYLYDYKNAQELNDSILKKEKNSKNIFILIVIIILIIIFLALLYYINRNRKISTNLKEAISFNKEKNTPKKEYNIDDKLEKSLLDGINDLKKSKDFLKPEFNINALAKKLNTNSTYLSYIINKESNQSFKQYITQLRTEYLIEKLKSDPKYRNYTIKSLGEEIGYTNASAFSRAFKKYKGVSPSEFIKNLEQ